MKKLILLIIILLFSCEKQSVIKRPNVILIMTDDQGYGDLGANNNQNIITPNLDDFADKSIRFNNFFVSPVCAPTRSSLMTGRYSLRTGVRDTYNGGAIMSSDETTIAEILKEANYSTGIFGKWHLGDNYPFRPSDQGFDESLIHLAGGIGQVGDFTNYYAKNTSYFDPILWKNNEQKKYEGYCSDIFTNNAIEFIEKNNLKLNQYCQFFTSTENDYKFGVTFSKEKKEGSFKLLNSMNGSKYRNTAMARSVAASAFFNSSPIFSELKKKFNLNIFVYYRVFLGLLLLIFAYL